MYRILSLFALLAVTLLFSANSFAENWIRSGNITEKEWDNRSILVFGKLKSSPGHHGCDGDDKMLEFNIEAFSIFAGDSFDVNHFYVDGINAGDNALRHWLDSWEDNEGERALFPLPPAGENNGLNWTGWDVVQVCVGAGVWIPALLPTRDLKSIVLWYDGPARTTQIPHPDPGSETTKNMGVAEDSLVVSANGLVKDDLDDSDVETSPEGITPEPVSGPRADLYPDYDIKRNGGEISANCDECFGKAVTAGEELEYKGAIKVANDDAGNWKRKDSVEKVEGTFFWRIPGLQDSWKEFCTEEYTISKLDEGKTIQGTCWWDVPMVPEEGYVLETAFCPDRDDIIWEEDETENRDKISDPIDDDGINCSRTERNYIQLPQYEPIGAINSANCEEVVGWAKDGNSVSPLWIRVEASGVTQLPDVLADSYRSDVGGNFGLRWTVPEEIKDGTAHTVSFTAVNVPIGNNVQIGQANLTCGPPVPPYDVATVATWIDGEYTLGSGEEFTIRGVVENLGSDIPGDVTVTSTLIHSEGTEYAMGSVVIPAGSLLSGWTADASLEAVAPSETGLYSLKTCVTAGFGESNSENNCLEENGPYIADSVSTDLSDDEEAAIWIMNQER